jgi:hypothetical protein
MSGVRSRVLARNLICHVSSGTRWNHFRSMGGLVASARRHHLASYQSPKGWVPRWTSALRNERRRKNRSMAEDAGAADKQGKQAIVRLMSVGHGILPRTRRLFLHRLDAGLPAEMLLPALTSHRRPVTSCPFQPFHPWHPALPATLPARS